MLPPGEERGGGPIAAFESTSKLSCLKQLPFCSQFCVQLLRRACLGGSSLIAVGGWVGWLGSASEMLCPSHAWYLGSHWPLSLSTRTSLPGVSGWLVFLCLYFSQRNHLLKQEAEPLCHFKGFAVKRFIQTQGLGAGRWARSHRKRSRGMRDSNMSVFGTLCSRQGTFRREASVDLVD